MDQWHKIEMPTENIYSGDAIYIVSSDWSSYHMIDLGSKKLIGSENGKLYYLEENMLYRTTVDLLIQQSFERVETLNSGWKYIAFSEDGEYTVY